MKKRINEAQNITELEDLYLPYTPNRRTRATIAREKGLEPLATWLMAQNNGSPTNEANKYIDTEKNVSNTDEALSGARDIIAEWINETAQARDRVRRLFERFGKISSKVTSGKEEEAQKYKDYFDWSEPVSRIPSHRLLAILRAANEGLLRYGIEPDEELALDTLNRLFVRYNNPSSEQIKLAAKDAYKRLMQPSLETEIRNTAKDKADTEAIHVFADNLMQLLLASPLGEKRVLAIDPGFRTGCKTVCLNEHGKLLYHTAIIHTTTAQQGVSKQHLLSKTYARNTK